jgi:hypothetical protein
VQAKPHLHRKPGHPRVEVGAGGVCAQPGGACEGHLAVVWVGRARIRGVRAQERGRFVCGSWAPDRGRRTTPTVEMEPRCDRSRATRRSRRRPQGSSGTAAQLAPAR